MFKYECRWSPPVVLTWAIRKVVHPFGNLPADETLKARGNGHKSP